MNTAEHIKSLKKAFNLSGKSINLFDPNIQETSTRYFELTDELGRKFRLYAFSERIVIESKVESSLLFTVNLPDIVCLANKPLGMSTHGHNIYVSQSGPNSVIDCVSLIESDIQDLGLDGNEGLFVYNNAVQLVLKGQRNLLRELSILSRIISLIEINFPEDELEIVDASKVPTEFQDLIPLFAEWAIGDDLEREEKINKLSAEELKKVTDAVFPKIEHINDYLDSFGREPLTYEAILLGNLAELASELLSAK